MPVQSLMSVQDTVTHRLVLINPQVLMHILRDHLHITILISLYQTLAQNKKEFSHY